MPPPPVLMTTAISSRLASLISTFESSIACAAAATASWLNRLIRRACLKSM